jgi:hypothetical protein
MQLPRLQGLGQQLNQLHKRLLSEGRRWQLKQPPQLQGLA